MITFLKWFGLIFVAVYLAGAFIALDLFWVATVHAVLRIYALVVVLALAMTMALIAGAE
jgi:hypothetical protein